MKTIDYPPLSPSLTVRDASGAIAFYKAAFGAEELYRLIDPQNGKIGHAEITIKGALLMLSDEYPEHGKTPEKLGGSPVRLSLMVDDVDAAYQKALDAGASSVRPPADQFYGHRSACLSDPFGHQWMISKEVKKMPPEEMQRLWNEMAGDCKA